MSVELLMLAGEDVDPPSLAGKVELTLGGPGIPSTLEIVGVGNISSLTPLTRN